MKRTLLFIVCVLASITISAQKDYVPFVEMGKQWHVVRTIQGARNHFDQYMMNEEVVLNGKTYMKMSRTEDDKAEIYNEGLLREENRKVYFYDTDMQEEFLLFDYSLKEGDTYETYSYEDQKMMTYEVLQVSDYSIGPKVISYEYDSVADSTVIQYRPLRHWLVKRADSQDWCLFGSTLEWLEGVGSIEGPLANRYLSRPARTISYLAYAFYNDRPEYYPFSFYDRQNRGIYGCDLTTYAINQPKEWNSHLTYERDSRRLHVYGELVLNCGGHNYAYFIDEPTDDPLVHKLRFEMREVGPLATCVSLQGVNFYVSELDPKINYIVVDDTGEHPVINKTPQNEYRPFVEEGKVWVVSGSGISSDGQSILHWTDYCYFEGDTIVGGQTCKLMKCVGNANGLIGAWYEQDKKVYYARYGNLPFELLYDFTLSSNDTIASFWYPLVVYKKSGGIPGFKGSYYEFWHDNQLESRWLEGVGSESWPYVNHPWMYDGAEGVLLACYVDDEVIYYNSEVEDPYSLGAKKRRFDFTHTTKIQPKTPKRRSEEPSLYGEYNDKLLGVNLDPVDDAYLVRITNETGKVVYEKAIDAGTIVALNIDISSYATGRYTVTVENSQETFTGEFETQTTGIEEVRCKKSEVRDAIYNLQGQRLNSLQKGLNIVNGKKVFVR